MAFAIETFSNVNPMGGLTLRAGKSSRQQKSLRLEKRAIPEKSHGFLVGAIIGGGAIAASAWMVATVAAMMTMTVSLTPDTGTGMLVERPLAPRTLTLALLSPHDHPVRLAQSPVARPAASETQTTSLVADAAHGTPSPSSFAGRFAGSAVTDVSPMPASSLVAKRGRVISSVSIASAFRQRLAAPILAAAVASAAKTAPAGMPPSMSFARLDDAFEDAVAAERQSANQVLASAAPSLAGPALTLRQPDPAVTRSSAELALADAAASSARGILAATPSAPSVAHLKTAPQLADAASTQSLRIPSAAKSSAAAGSPALASLRAAASARPTAGLALAGSASSADGGAPAVTPPSPVRPVETAMLLPDATPKRAPGPMPAKAATQAAQNHAAAPSGAASVRTQDTPLPDDAPPGSPFDLVMASARPSSDDDGLSDVPLPARRPDAAAGKTPPRSPERPSRLSRDMLAYAPTNDDAVDEVRTYDKRAALPGVHSRTAIYDIQAATVYLPSGERLEAHSGLGGMIDNPRFVSQKNRGPTPPHAYDLTIRESLFHGVEALRLNPVEGGNLYGRDGLLAHTYMLGRRGDSNGCVSFKDYRRFLAAFKRGEVTRLVVVPHLADAQATRFASR